MFKASFRFAVCDCEQQYDENVWLGGQLSTAPQLVDAADCSRSHVDAAISSIATALTPAVPHRGNALQARPLHAQPLYLTSAHCSTPLSVA